MIRSSKVDLCCTLGFSLVCALLSCIRLKESHNSLKQSEVPESQSQFKSLIRMNSEESFNSCKISEKALGASLVADRGL